MQGFSVAVVAAFVAALALAQPASPAPPADFARAKAGLSRSLARAWLDPDEVSRYSSIAYRASRAIPRLPGARASNLASVLRLVARQRDRYTRPRALALFGMLDLNVRYLARRALPPAGRDVADPDGVLYRSFPGYGLQFHPLANFSRLTQLAVSGREDGGILLAQALADRGVPTSGGALVWEYYFPFSGGSPPWTSGMAQAVAAAAFARASLSEEARRAFVAIRKGLLVWIGGKPWVRLYRFSSMAVLNAQLQAAYSTELYSRLAPDPDAAALAAQLRASASSLLPRFDTGYWSLYSLGGSEAALNYHSYVVSLLRQLAVQTGETTWSDWQLRFDDQLYQPPLLSTRRLEAAIVGRRGARITFWLSKVSRVTLSVGGQARAVWLSRGTHTLTWSARGRRPGAYAGSIAAVDLAGNRTRISVSLKVLRTFSD